MRVLFVLVCVAFICALLVSGAKRGKKRGKKRPTRRPTPAPASCPSACGVACEMRGIDANSPADPGRCAQRGCLVNSASCASTNEPSRVSCVCRYASRGPPCASISSMTTCKAYRPWCAWNTVVRPSVCMEQVECALNKSPAVCVGACKWANGACKANQKPVS